MAGSAARDLTQIKCLAFDAYGTLYDVHSVIELAEHLFPGHGTALSNAWRLKQLQYSWQRSLMNHYADFWKVTEDSLVFATNSLKLTLDALTRKQLMDAYLSLKTFADVAPGLKELSAAGFKLAILSNGAPRMLREVTKNAGVQQFLDDIISVDAVRIYKPSPRTYQLVSKKLGTTPEATGFVSSNAWDIAGAASFGLTTFWINRTNQPTDELGFPAHWMVTKLTDLLPLLKAAT
jgi:2-haloacid dehalogenase